jgi:hypothetical protein
LAVWLLAKAQNSSCRKLNILGFLSEQALYLATLWGWRSRRLAQSLWKIAHTEAVPHSYKASFFTTHLGGIAHNGNFEEKAKFPYLTAGGK